jgi:hypothetical protein
MDSNCLQPLFKSENEIKEEIETAKKTGTRSGHQPNIDFAIYAKIRNMSSNMSGPQLVYKIISESEYVTDPSNNRAEIIENWYSKNIDERSTVISFIKNSGQ